MKPALVQVEKGEVPPEPANDAPALPLPAHFRSKRLKAAWADLIESTAPALHTKENRFTFEFAAISLAKVRAGKPMNATESKELKKQLVALGLAKEGDGGGKKKPSKASKYLDDE